MVDTTSSLEQLLHFHVNSKEDLAEDMLSELGKQDYLEIGDDSHLKADVIMISGSWTIDFMIPFFNLIYLIQVNHVIVRYYMPVNAVRPKFPRRK